jgi:nucleotide-binding universal stress UspA family protein
LCNRINNLKEKDMTTLLVTTDLSNNSKTAIRFALQLASQTPCKLVFYHAIEFFPPPLWSKEEVDDYVKTQKETAHKDLGRFLDTVFRTSAQPYTPFESVVETSMNVDKSIIACAQNVEAEFICIGTHGAGLLKKVIGTNASKLVNTSPIPVIVVPKNYRTKPITKIGYSTDLADLNIELPIVQKLATRLNAKVDVFHFDYNLHDYEQKTFDHFKTKYQSNNVVFHDPIICLDYSLVENIQNAITKQKSSLCVMFTHQKPNWFEQFFFESKTATMTFDMKVPLVAYSK